MRDEYFMGNFYESEASKHQFRLAKRKRDTVANEDDGSDEGEVDDEEDEEEKCRETKQKVVFQPVLFPTQVDEQVAKRHKS